MLSEGSFFRRSPLEYTEIAENEELTERHYKKCLELLKAESEALRADGLPVDSECRIDPGTFKDMIRPEEIKRDMERVRNKEAGFKKTPETTSGNLLEAAKTIAFNEAWFDKRLLTVRTSKYDDYFNGVDELIFDRESGQILAAVDTTTSPNLKQQNLIERVREGATIKYGLGPEKNRFVKKPLRRVPYFIISMKPDDLIALADELEKKKGTQNKRIERNIVALLLRESEQFISHTSGFLQQEYRKAKILFQELSS